MLRMLLDDSPVGMFVADAIRNDSGQLIDFRYAAVNDKIANITGLTDARQIEGQLMSNVFPRSFDRGSYFERFRQVLEQGKPETFETDYTNRVGKTGWFRTTITPHNDSVTVIAVDITAIKQTEQQLQKQTQLLEGVLNASPAAIFAYDPIRDEAGNVHDFRITVANRAAAELSPRQLVPSTDPHWLIGKTIRAISSNSQALPLMLAANQTGEQQRVILDYPQFKRTFDFSIINYGEGIVTTTSDITDLYQQQKLLQTILDVSPTGIVLYNAIRDPQTGQIIDFGYRLTNPTNLHVTGRTHSELIEGTLLTIFPSSRGTDFLEILIRVTETGEAQSHTFPYHDDGVEGWFESRFVQQDDGVLFTFIDITRIKQAELDRQKQAERLTRLIDCLPVAVFVSEAVYDTAHPEQVIDFTIRDVNLLGTQPHGLSREQIVGYKTSELFPNDLRNGIFERYVEVVKTQQPQSFEFDYVTADGTRRWLDIRLMPFDESSVVSTTLDITPIKQAQLSLETMNAELRRSNDNLQQFAYVASHDLQEPLRKVQSFGDLLLNQHMEHLSPDAVDLVQRMQSAASRMSVLIKDLLTYSRVATQQETTAPQSLNALIVAVLDDLDLAVRESSAEVYIEDLPTVPGDAGQLRQLFQNLIGNALKFRKPGQPPVISITHRRATDLPVQAASGQKTGRAFWEICVTDNGIGFDEKYTDRIFQVFQRLHNKSHYAGTGIGLALCQKVAENHGGFIKASRKPGEGATFRVYLPA